MDFRTSFLAAKASDRTREVSRAHPKRMPKRARTAENGGGNFQALKAIFSFGILHDVLSPTIA